MCFSGNGMLGAGDQLGWSGGGGDGDGEGRTARLGRHPICLPDYCNICIDYSIELNRTMSTDNESGLRASHVVGPVSCERCEHLSAGLRTTGLNPNRASPKRPREILYETVVTREIHNPVSIPTNPRLRNPCTKLCGTREIHSPAFSHPNPSGLGLRIVNCLPSIPAVS